MHWSGPDVTDWLTLEQHFLYPTDFSMNCCDLGRILNSATMGSLNCPIKYVSFDV